MLHDLNTDPGEVVNLIGKSNPDCAKYLAKARELNEEMVVWLRERGSAQADALEKMSLD